MKVEYVAHMGDDTLVVNAARVSFDKWHNEFDDEKDSSLIKYLAKHNHWTPFGHPQITLRITAPVFIRTQCFKHKVGFTENEVSRRYVDAEPEFFVPDVWRGKAANKKQGSSDEAVDISGLWSPRGYYACIDEVYSTLLGAGVAPEQARMILPQSMYTSWIWTGSLAAFARFYSLRTSEDAQKEIKDLAEMVGDIISPLYPYSWEALIRTQNTAVGGTD